MNNLEDFSGIVFQCDERLNPIFSNKTFKSLKASEQSELVKVCAEVLATHTPMRIQRHLSDEFFVFMVVPLRATGDETSGVALTGFPISFQIFKEFILNNVSDGVFYISVNDGELFFRGVNSTFLELSGLKEKDIVDRNVLDVVPKESQSEVMERYRSTLLGGKVTRWEVQSNFPTGTRYGELILIPICYENKCHALFGVVHDVTERKTAEMEFAKNYSILHELVESTSDIIFIKDLSSRYIMVNSAFAKFLGKSTFDLIGRKDLEIFSEETASKFMTNDRQTLESGFMQHFEEEFDVNNRHYYFHSAKGPYRDEKGEIAGTLGISRDITEMIRAERNLAHSNSLLRATLNATADGILVIDRNKHIIHYNQPFLDLWKISEDLLRNSEYEEVLRQVLDQLRNPEECLARLVQLDENPAKKSYDLLTFKDGRLLERYTIPQILDGEVIGRVFSYRDLSPRQQQLQHSSSTL